jgi:hypothetical protein
VYTRSSTGASHRKAVGGCGGTCEQGETGEEFFIIDQGVVEITGD